MTFTKWITVEQIKQDVLPQHQHEEVIEILEEMEENGIIEMEEREEEKGIMLKPETLQDIQRYFNEKQE